MSDDQDHPLHQAVTRDSIPDNTSSVASDDEADSAPLLTSETTNEIPYPSNPEAINAIFASDEENAEAGASETPAPKKKPLWLKIVAGVVIFILLIFVIRGFWRLAHRHKQPITADEVCTTSACVTAAAGILADVDQSVDPCEDFFQYSCGGWLSSHDIASDRGDYFTSSIMAEDSQRLSRNILEGTFVGSSAAERAIWEKASGVYSACMDTDRIAEVGGEPIYPILEKIQAVYPLYAGALESVRTWVEGPSEVMVKDEARTTTMDLTDAVLYLQTMAITALIQFDIDADDMDPDFTVLRLYQVMNGLPSKEYYTRPSITIPYTDAIKQVFANVLADVNTTLTPRQLDDRYAALAAQVVEFEAQLASISLDFEELFDGSKTYHPFTISDLQKTFAPIEFTYLIQSMTGSPTMPGQVIVTYPQYLIDLNKLIPTVSRETLQTYFMWKAIEVYAGHLSDSVARPVTEFRNALRGISSTVRPERWKTCVAEVDSLTGWILGKYYTDRAFSPVAKEMGEEIINGIKDAFVDKLNVLPWMDVNTKGVAIEKVHRLVQKIGYPDQSPDIKSADSLADYYKDLKISATDYFGNYKSARMQAAVEEWQSLGKPTDRAAWGMTPSTVNAYYNPPLGEIVFPAGILQPPVFSEHQPSYMNYGAFGAVAGHELSHAFDNQGRAYDENGRLHDWWTPKTSQEFDTRAQCFIDQYSEYTVVDDEGNVLHVNGKFTEGENIADNGGIAAAFNAWKTHEAREPSPLLPGVNMTKEQLFFVNYARWWCGKTRPGTAAQRIYTDPHSPSFVRVLAAAEDSQDFIDAFQCKNKSPRCVLW